jgi:hypothetical protein
VEWLRARDNQPQILPGQVFETRGAADAPVGAPALDGLVKDTGLHVRHVRQKISLA